MAIEKRNYALNEERLTWGGVNVRRFEVPNGASLNKLPFKQKPPRSVRVERQPTNQTPSIGELPNGVEESVVQINPPAREPSQGLLRRITSGFQGRQPSKA